MSKKERKALKNATSTISKSVLNGITKGMASAEKDLVTLMSNVLDNVANTAKRVVNGKFTGCRERRGRSLFKFRTGEIEVFPG